jgi:hypothetical protein
MMSPNLEELYLVLREWAQSRKPQTYKALSESYYKRTGDHVPWHGGWDVPLDTINKRLAAVGAPAISAVVILQDQNEPGGRFWGCASTVPPRPRTDSDRIATWTRILDDVHAYKWPPTLGELVSR